MTGRAKKPELLWCDGTGPADESERKNASRNGLVKLVMAVCLLKFTCYFVTYYVLGLLQTDALAELHFIYRIIIC